MKTELTISESQRLIELGVDPKLASKSRFNIEFYDGIKHNIPRPVFDLADVIDILPKKIDGFSLEMVSDEDRWYVGYYFNGFSKSSAPELIDALCQLLCWVLEKGYMKLKTEGQ